MGFKPPAAGLPKKLAVGDSVAFEFKQTAAGQFQIVGIKPLAQPEPAR